MSDNPAPRRRSCGKARAMKKPQTVGDRVKLLRKERRMTQAVVADAVGVARSTYTGIETGEDNPSREILVAIADFFEASLDWIEGRMHKVHMPDIGQFVKDPDKLALLAFWDALSDSQRDVFVNMLRHPPRRTDVG